MGRGTWTMKRGVERWSSSVVLGLLVVGNGVAAASGDDPRVDLALRAVPLRTAVESLYRGSGVTIAAAPAVADRLVSVDLRGVPRSVALRMLARAAGSPPVAVQLAGGTLRLSQVPSPPSIPPVITRQIQSPARAPRDRPFLLGGTSATGSSASRSGPPFVPGGARRSAVSGGGTGFFVTATILPDPAEDRPPRRRP